MNFYITSGTSDFLQKLIDKHPNENLILLEGQGKAVVLHETNGKTIFSLPKNYEVADTFGELQQKGFFVLYHLSVEGDRRDLFKQQFIKASGDTLKNDASLISYRLLMPKKNNEHIIFMSQWGGPVSYEVWTQSAPYKNFFEPLLQVSASSVQKIFDGESYISTYSAKNMEE